MTVFHKRRNPAEIRLYKRKIREIPGFFQIQHLYYATQFQPSFSAIFLRKSSVCMVTGSLSDLNSAARSPVI